MLNQRRNICSNLNWLPTYAKHKDRIVIRIPLIPQYNTPEDQKRSQQALEELGFVNFGVFEYIVRAKTSHTGFLYICRYREYVITKSASTMADSFSSFGASFDFHATMNRILAAVTL